uniref:uncharacterized protein LOC122608402 isoform X2 n=1 Tax=Erigeron canadensis TaxID=72917 RepID=UPI001CB9BBA4|nr:uncharacterized protein LOC122608402 isoform X2 [Erigeron canadensis]
MYPTEWEYSSHPYFTRSRPHPPPPHQLEQQNDTHTPGRPVDKVPITIYNSVQLVVEAHNVYKAKKTMTSKSDLQFATRLLEKIAASYRSKGLLSDDWQYDPDAPRTLEPDLDTISPWLYGNPTYPSTRPLKVDDVPLRPDEMEGWSQFKDKYDESTHVSQSAFRCRIVYPLSTKHPFVSSLVSFAVNGYNEAFELFVEKGNSDRLRSPKVSKCTYYIMESFYCFTMIVKADEDGVTGIYEVEVDCCCVDGNRTLKEFMFQDVKQVKKRRASKLKSPKALCLPNINITTKMCERITVNDIVYGLYDYSDELYG